MMYLLEPDLAMWWSRQPAGLWLATARSTGYDLAQIDDWTPAERQADAVMVRLAMRHGVACGRGLVLDGGLVSLRWAGASSAPDQGAGGPSPLAGSEPVDPRENLARSLDAVRRQTGLEPAAPGLVRPEPTDPELETALAAPTDAAAVRAWVLLGGSPPVPL